MEFWKWLVIMLIYIPLIYIWVFALFDIFNRVDLGGWAKALWVIFVLILPLLGMLIYFIARPVTEQDVATQKQVKEKQDYYRTAQATEQLYALQKMLESGQISQEKYDKRKAKILAKIK
jgi:glucan phosphoethanolaminetransferase (alkaline phosphatase superfamily)